MSGCAHTVAGVRAATAIASAMLPLAVSGGVGASMRVPVWGAPVYAGTLTHGEPDEIRTVDLNEDGLRDAIVGPLVWERFDAQAPIFLINKGHGRLVDETAALFDGSPPSVEFDREIVVADFNGDHRPDLFIADTGLDNVKVNPTYAGQQDRLILSTPDGRWRDASGNLPQQRSFTHSAAAADVDGDGAIDIFEGNLGCCGRDHPQAQILVNDGAGHFTAAAERLSGMPLDQYGNTFSTASAFADVNGDRHLDLIIGGSDHAPPSGVFVNDGQGNFRSFDPLPAKLYPPSIGIVLDIVPVDVNGDGAIDLLTAETPSDPYYVGTKIQVLTNDGHGHFTDETTTRMPHEPQTTSWPDRLLVEDFNDDTKPDLAVQYASAGHDPTPFWLNENGVFIPIKGASDGYSTSLGPVGFINGAGPHALVSIQYADSNGGTPRYFVTPQIVVPPAPTAIRATTTLASGIRVAWSKVSGADAYAVWRAPAVGGAFTHITSTTGTSSTDRTAAHGRSYRYAVAARNAAGTSSLSAPVLGRRR